MTRSYSTFNEIDPEFFRRVIEGSRDTTEAPQTSSGIMAPATIPQPRPDNLGPRFIDTTPALEQSILSVVAANMSKNTDNPSQLANAVVPQPQRMETPRLQEFESMVPVEEFLRGDTTRAALGSAPTASLVPQPRPDTSPRADTTTPAAPERETPSEVTRVQPSADSVRSVRNNNPGNIERNQTAWQGMSDDQSSDERFIVFDTPEMGVRAMARTLNTYNKRYGLNTIRDIIYRWAPPNENDTENYIRVVSERSGVDPNREINLQDNPEEMNAVIREMIFMEGGSEAYDYFDPEVVARGIQLAQD